MLPQSQGLLLARIVIGKGCYWQGLFLGGSCRTGFMGSDQGDSVRGDSVRGDSVREHFISWQLEVSDSLVAAGKNVSSDRSKWVQ